MLDHTILTVQCNKQITTLASFKHSRSHVKSTASETDPKA